MKLLKKIQIEPYLNLICVFLWPIIWIFLSQRGITLPKIIRPDPNSISSTRPKFNLNLRILVTHLYTEFRFKMSICNGDEWKLKINGIFQSPRGITLPKIIRLDPNLHSTWVFSWHIYIPNFNLKCQFLME